MNATTHSPVRALDPHYYTDTGVFEQEKKRIFQCSWQLIGHQSQLPNPGDYFTFSLGDDHLFALHGADSQLRVFYNVCQHRAHELLAAQGNTRLIACPYHAWTYELDGRLRKARNSDRVAGFQPSTICLTQVRCELFCGFMFVNLDADAQSMEALFPGVEAEIRRFVPNIDRLKFAYRHQADIQANWKVAVENYNECYHCRIVHKAFTQGVVAAESYYIEPQGKHFRHIAHAPKQSAYRVDIESGNALDYSSWYLWPLASIQVYPGNVVNTYRWLPRDPGKTVVYREWFLPSEQPTVEEKKLIDLDYTTTFAEDLDLMNSVQRGLNSRGYRPGPLIIDPAGGVDSEHPVYEIKKQVLAALEE